MKFRFDKTSMTSVAALGCFITVGADGAVSGSQAPLTVSAGGEPTAQGPIAEANGVTDAIRDPEAPPETDAEKEARIAKERENETPEAKAARETKEAEEAAKAEALKNETPEQKTEREAKEASDALEAKNKAWLERDKTKDVPVTDEQKAEIGKLAKTPEQIAAMEEFTLETNTTGDLSPASRAKAAELWGVTPEMVDRYVSSVIATNKANTGETTEAPATYDNNSDDQTKWSPDMKAAFKERMDALEGAAGGADNWKAFTDWANVNLTAAEATELQQAIGASPVVGAALAKVHLARWKAEGNGGGPADLSRGAGTGQKPPQAAVQGFASKAEQNAALNDPRYAKDAAYRAAVDARMIASNFSQPSVENAFYRGANAGTMMV